VEDSSLVVCCIVSISKQLLMLQINPFMPEVVIFWICAWDSYMLPRKIQGTRIWGEKNFIIFHCWVMWRSKNGTL